MNIIERQFETNSLNRNEIIGFPINNFCNKKESCLLFKQVNTTQQEDGVGHPNHKQKYCVYIIMFICLWSKQNP